MSWAEVNRINDDLSLPLNKAIGEIYDEDGNKCYIEHETDKSRLKLFLPYRLVYGRAVVYNDKIHILGGLVYSDTGEVTSHFEWNGVSWSAVFTLPYNFYNGSAVVYNNEIHILGSGQGNSYTKHYKWNGTSWTEVSTLPYNFYYGSAVVYNNEIHILGGDGGNANEHYKWNGTSWSLVSTIPYNFSHGSAVVYNNEIHILGSTDFAGRIKHYKWNGTSWTNVSTIPYSFVDGVAVVYNNEIHVLGSNDSSYTRRNHYKWNGTLWTEVSALPYNFYSGSAVVYNNEIHILGGGDTYDDYVKHYIWDGSSWQGDVLYSKIAASYIYINGNKLPFIDKRGIKSVQTGEATASNTVVNINHVDPSKCIVIIDPVTNGSTQMSVTHVLSESKLKLSGLNKTMGWQVIEFS